eukprot:10806721-Prorocentrum_lima.AAC.1
MKADGFELGAIPEQEACKHVTDTELCRSIGYRCNLNRFVGSLAVARHKLKTWHRDTFRRTFMALELDFLKGKASDAKLRLTTAEVDDPGEGGGSTSGARI